MLIPKSMEGRYCAFLLQGVSTQEIKVSYVLPDEIVGIYSTGDEVHISPYHIVAWWPDIKRDNLSARGKKGAKAKRVLSLHESSSDEGNESEATITPTSPKVSSVVTTTKPGVKRKG
jgi:hypothetical protein